MLLSTIPSEFKRSTVKMGAKDLVDIEGGTAKMRARLDRNFNDPTREPIRKSCAIRDASGDGQAWIGGGASGGGGGGGEGGEDVEMQDNEMLNMGWIVTHRQQFLDLRKADYEMQVDAQKQIKAMEIDAEKQILGLKLDTEKQMHEVKQKDRDHELEAEMKRRAMLADETMHARRVELRKLINEETNVAAKNILYEEYLHLCKVCAFGPPSDSATGPVQPGTGPVQHAVPVGEYKSALEVLRARSDFARVGHLDKLLGEKLSDEYNRNHGERPKYRTIPGPKPDSKNRKLNHYLPADLVKVDQFLKEIQLEQLSKINKDKGQPNISNLFNRL